MGSLVGLPGIADGAIDNVRFFKSVHGCMKLLRTERGATAAGDYGAVNVYLDDDGEYRCIFMVHFMTRSSVSMGTKRAVMQWLKEWLPHCYHRWPAG
jgi:hypothetical protein